MKIVIAPDSFKESVTAAEAAVAIERGLARSLPDAQCTCLPMADGGEGSAATMLAACGGAWQSVRVHDPLMRPIHARYALLEDGRAVIEMAEAAGLHLLSTAERNPLVTSTYGVGELVRDALDRGVRHIIMAIGGSATNDAGAGMLRALGYAFYDAQDSELLEGGGALANLARINLSSADSRLAQCRLTIACDVDNPLCGAKGASHVFAAQKGANPEMIAALDNALQHFADLSSDAFNQQNRRHESGMGAAGGLGYALAVYLGAEMRSGVELIADAVGLDGALRHADIVITGEGRMDGQTASGKVAHGVLQYAQRHGVPVIALAGCLGEDIGALDGLGFAAVLPIIPAPQPLASLLENGADNLERTAQQVGALLALSDLGSLSKNG